LHDLITQADRQFEVVLVNAPPASVASDFMLIGAETGGALIVTVGGQTRVEHAASLVGQCRELGIRIVGSTMLTL
jgi:Mrp family chromosome partitioning ATPase